MMIASSTCSVRSLCILPFGIADESRQDESVDVISNAGPSGPLGSKRYLDVVRSVFSERFPPALSQVDYRNMITSTLSYREYLYICGDWDETGEVVEEELGQDQIATGYARSAWNAPDGGGGGRLVVMEGRPRGRLWSVLLYLSFVSFCALSSSKSLIFFLHGAMCCRVHPMRLMRSDSDEPLLKMKVDSGKSRWVIRRYLLTMPYSVGMPLIQPQCQLLSSHYWPQTGLRISSSTPYHCPDNPCLAYREEVLGSAVIHVVRSMSLKVYTVVPSSSSLEFGELRRIGLLVSSTYFPLSPSCTFW
ncbi:hypothetical protein Tco_1157034 [Tanacetum coccineum]